ncbi:MAG: hypothetical protein ACP5EN_07540 [Rhodovulum sp.]
MIQTDAAIEERDVSRIRCVRRLQQALHRLRPLGLFLRRHALEKVGQDRWGSERLHSSQMENGGSDLVVRSMTDNDNVFGKLKTAAFPANPETLCPVEKRFGFRPIEPDFPRMFWTLGRKPFRRPAPKSAQASFHDG